MCCFREESNDAKLRASEMIMDSSLSILLEGDCDELLYSKFFDLENCTIEVMDGKENLLEVLGHINAQKPEAAIAIIDADLDYLTGTKYGENVFMTDTHDADSDMFLSDAFFRVAKEFYSKNKVANNVDLEKIRKEIIKLEIPMACLRIYDKEKHLNFAFKTNNEGDSPFPYGKFIESNKNEMEHKGVKALVRVACSYNGDQGRGLSQDEIELGVDEVMSRKIPVHFIIHGHDLMHILALSLQRFGKKNKQRRNNEDWESAFRLAYSIDDFSKTKMYQKLKDYAIDMEIPFIR